MASDRARTDRFFDNENGASSRQLITAFSLSKKERRTLGRFDEVNGATLYHQTPPAAGQLSVAIDLLARTE
jgi:hypothetical protein